MAPWALPAATLLAGLFANRGNGGSEFSDEQKRLYGTQADIADMMADLYQSRIANEERYLGGAMDRVFGYVDDSLGRNPDLLYAPGIFEFMPRGARGPEVPRPAWEPYVPGDGTDSPPPEEFPAFPEQLDWQDFAETDPIVDALPPVDVGRIASMLPWQYAQLLRGGPRTLEDALALGAKDEYGSWFDKFKEEYGDFFDNLPEHLRTAEDTVREALYLETKPTAEQREAFDMGSNIGRYDPEDLFTWGTRDVSSETFAPPGEYDPGIPPVSVDSVTGEVKGPVVPPKGTPLDLPVEDFVRAQQARMAGALPITGLIPGEQPERAHDRRDRIAREDAAIEVGEYRELTPEQFSNLQRIAEGPGDFLFRYVERDGKVYLADAMGMSDEQIEKMLAGTYDAAGAVEEVWNRRVNPYFPTPPTPTPKPDGRVERPGPRFFDL